MSNEKLHDVICPFCKTVALQASMIRLANLAERTEQGYPPKCCSCGEYFLISEVDYYSSTETSEKGIKHSFSAAYIIAKDWEELEKLAKFERVQS